MYEVLKRDKKTIEQLDKNKIKNAIYKSILGSHSEEELNERFNTKVLTKLTNDVYVQVIRKIEDDYIRWCNDIELYKEMHDGEEPVDNEPKHIIYVEDIQDIVERTLIKAGFADTAKAYILYRQKRTEIRNTRDSISKTIKGILMDDAKDNDAKRENGNINGDTPMGTMLQIASGVSKNFYIENMMSKDIAKAESEGRIHIHDLDFYKLTLTCVQMDCLKLFKGGFNTGKGKIREPNSITSYASLAAVAIQAEQNFQHSFLCL